MVPHRGARLVDFDGTTEYSPLREATIAVDVTAGVKVVYGGRRAPRLLGLPETTTNYTLAAADGRTAASGTLTERTATVHYPAASRGVHYLTVYGDALGPTTFTLQPPR